MKTINQTGKSDKKKGSPGKRAVRGLLAVLLAVSLFFYRDSFQKIWEGLLQVTAGEICVSMLLAGMGYVLEGMTICCMMGAVISKPAAKDGIFIAFVCEFYRLTTLGNGSGVAEIHYLCKCRAKEKIWISGGEAESIEQAEERMAPGSAAVLTMIQYMMKRIAIMVLGLAGFLVLYQRENTRKLCREYSVFVGIGCLITAGIILVFWLFTLSDKAAAGAFWGLDWLSRKIPSRERNFQKWKEQVGLLNRSGKRILRQKKRMLLAVVIQMGKLLLFYLIPACLLCGKASIGIGGCIFLMALCVMLSGVIPAPSGAGALEFEFLLFFGRFTAGEAAVAAILLFRFATWICPAVAGGVFLAAERIKKR